MLSTRSTGVAATRMLQDMNLKEHRTRQRWEGTAGLALSPRDHVSGGLVSPSCVSPMAVSPSHDVAHSPQSARSLSPARGAAIPGKVKATGNGVYFRDSVSPQRQPFNFASPGDREKFYKGFVGKPKPPVDLYR